MKNIENKQVAKRLQKAIEIGTENLTEVKSLKDLKKTKMNFNYFTYNHDMLLRMKGNRGGDEEGRVKDIEKEILTGDFDYQYQTVRVGVDDVICDGRHRQLALKKFALPIVFQRVRKMSPEEVSKMNEYSKPKWDARTNFKSAIELNRVAAIWLDKLRDKVHIHFNLNKRNGVSVLQLYGCVMGNIKYFSGGKFSPKIGDYNDALLTKLTERVESDVWGVGRFRDILNRYNVDRLTDVMKQVMKLHFDKNNDFDIHKFCDIIEKTGYNPDKGDAGKLATNLYNKHIKIFERVVSTNIERPKRTKTNKMLFEVEV